MKQFLILVSAFCLTQSNSLKAQVIDDVAGKTYYYYDESTHKKPKEVFHHKQMVTIFPDPNNYGEYIDSMYYVKNGPYTRYYEGGTLECSGFYKDEKKDGIWKYYDVKGKLLKEEKYTNGVKVK